MCFFSFNPQPPQKAEAIHVFNFLKKEPRKQARIYIIEKNYSSERKPISLLFI